MEVTYPLARVFTDKTNNLNVFFDESPIINKFVQIKYIGKSIVEFCELDFSECFDAIKKLDTKSVPSNFEDIKKSLWEIVDLLIEKHSYVQKFMNNEMIKIYYNKSLSKEEQINKVIFLFRYYADLQNLYREALTFCLDEEVLTEYTLPEQFIMFGNIYPDYNKYMLVTRYGIAPISYGEFDETRIIRYNDPAEVDIRKVLADIHRDSQTSINMATYFMIENLGDMLYLEFMEMLKRGIRVKHCALCDKYFVLADKRKREYCDRIYKNNRTCKQIGAKQKFNQSVENDSFLQEFQTIYNRMYSRYYRIDAFGSSRDTNKISEDKFKAWSDSASELKRAYKQKEISGEDMIAAVLKQADELYK